MPRLTPSRLVTSCALALAVSALPVAAATAKGVPANLRVVGSGGKVLAEETLGAGTASIKTSPQATCFGKGTGGSGESVTVPGATALGLLAQASQSTGSLRPLLVSDHFDFGLALCGVGSSVAEGEASWYLKVNHKGAQVSGDAVKLRSGDDVLWDLAPSFPYPDDLELIAPSNAKARTPFKVRVLAYDEKGKGTPVKGATVTGATAPTDAGGRTTVVLGKPGKLVARFGKDIPSAREVVCIGGKCPGGK